MAGAAEHLVELVEALPRELLPGTDPEAAFLPVLDGLARAFGYERALVALTDDRAHVLRGRFGRGIADQIAEAFQVPVANLQDPSVVALQTGVPQRVDDVPSDERITTTTRELLTELGFDSFVVTPLRAPGQEPIGVVLLSKGIPASDADVQALVPFASQAGSLLAQARDVAELRIGGEAHAVDKEGLWWMDKPFPDPVAVAVDQKQLVLPNHASGRLVKTTRDPLVQSRRAQVAMRNDAKFTSFLAQLSLDPAPKRSGELRLTDVDTGEELEMQVTANEVRDSVGATVATVSVMQDVGRLRELERRRLEQALFDSEKLAATGRLAASIAHEINNPLEAIQNALYLLVKRIPEDDPNAKFLNIAMKETERMRRILRQMLGFYRPAADLVPTDLKAVIVEPQTLIPKRPSDRSSRTDKVLD